MNSSIRFLWLTIGLPLFGLLPLLVACSHLSGYQVPIHGLSPAGLSTLHLLALLTCAVMSAIITGLCIGLRDNPEAEPLHSLGTDREAQQSGSGGFKDEVRFIVVDREDAWLYRRIEFAVNGHPSTTVIEYDGRGIGYETVLVNGLVASRQLSRWWFVPTFVFSVPTFGPARLHVRIWPWLRIRDLQIEVAGIPVYSEHRIL